MRGSLFMCAVLLGCAAVRLDAATLEVGVGKPFAKIQAALDAAADGDSVVVYPGTYVEELWFSDKAVTVRSRVPTSPSCVAATIIQPLTLSGAEFWDCERDTVLSGFTITLGSYFEGSAVSIRNCSPTITNNVIKANEGVDGAIQCLGGEALITGNLITGNTSRYGAVTMIGSNAVVSANTISANTTSREGGAVYCDGGSPVVSGNLICANSASSGAGIYCQETTQALITANVICGNSADTDGGGILCVDAEVTVAGNTVCANSADRGGGLACDNSIVTVANSLICSAAAGGGLSVIGGAPPSVRYCDVWNNTGGNYVTMPSCTGSDGNLSVNPLFACVSIGDYHLKSQGGRWDPRMRGWVLDAETSPALDAADPAAAHDLAPAPDGGRADMGAYGNAAEASKTPDRAPTAPAVVITPQAPRAGQELSATASGSSDPDGDAIRYEYQWACRPPGADWGPWSRTGPVLPADLTLKNDQWRVRARAVDAPVEASAKASVDPHFGPWTEQTVTIRDTPPPAPAVLVIPRKPLGGTALSAQVSGGDDPDGDAVDFRYEWSRSLDGGLTWGEWGFAGRVLSETTRKGEAWKARAHGVADGAHGEWAESPPMRIEDAPPTNPQVSIKTGHPLAGQDLTAAAVGSVDPDGDAVEYKFQWSSSSNAGVSWSSWLVNGKVLPGGLTVAGQLWRVQAHAVSGDPRRNSEWVISTPVAVGAAAPVPLTVSAACRQVSGRSLISLQLSAAAHVCVTVSSRAGKPLATLPVAQFAPGSHSLYWNGRTAAGTVAPAGSYLLIVEARQPDGARARAVTLLQR